MEYGRIDENGYLRVEDVEPYTYKKTDETGNDVEVVVSIEEQLMQLGGEWKQLDEIDSEELTKGDDTHSVAVTPYDAGERISFRYDVVFDKQKAQIKIDQLKKELHDEDYKIIKAYECSLSGEQLPYDIKQLHIERNRIRDDINQLEHLICNEDS